MNCNICNEEVYGCTFFTNYGDYIKACNEEIEFKDVRVTCGICIEKKDLKRLVEIERGLK